MAGLLMRNVTYSFDWGGQCVVHFERLQTSSGRTARVDWTRGPRGVFFSDTSASSRQSTNKAMSASI